VISHRIQVFVQVVLFIYQTHSQQTFSVYIFPSIAPQFDISYSWLPPFALNDLSSYCLFYQSFQAQFTHVPLISKKDSLSDSTPLQTFLLFQFQLNGLYSQRNQFSNDVHL
jgi:hypothetical protein